MMKSLALQAPVVRPSGLSVLFCMMLFAFVAAPAFAQVGAQIGDRSKETLPEAKSVFEKYIEALGGREKVFSVRSKYLRGVYDGDPFSNTVALRLWQDAPNFWHLQIAEPAGREVNIAYDGKDAWQASSPGREMWLEGPRRAEVVENADFYAEANYEKRYKKIQTLSRAMFRGKQCVLVGAETHSGRSYVVVFDEATGLQAGVQAYVLDEGKEIPFTVTYENYKEFEGLMVPTSIMQQVARDGTRPSVWEIREVKLNSTEKHDYSPPESLGSPPSTNE